MLKQLIATTDSQQLREQGKPLSTRDLDALMTDFYHRLNTLYALSGTFSKDGVARISFKAEPSKYFPSIQMGRTLLLTDDVSVSVERVDLITIYVSDLFLDVSLKLQDGCTLHMTAHPVLEKRDELAAYLGLAPTVCKL